MKNEIKKIKSSLRNKATEVAVFDSNNYSKDIPSKQFVLLEDALKAIDDVMDLHKKADFDNNRGQEIPG